VLELGHVHPVLVPVGHAVQPVVVVDGPELRDLTPERPRDRREQARRPLVKALRFGKCPRDAVLHLQASRVTLPVGAEGGYDHREHAARRHHAHADEVLAAPEGVRAKAEHKRERQREHGHSGGVAWGRTGSGDQRTGHEELHQHHRRTHREVDRGHDADGCEPSKKRAASAGRIP
jgi:hypothetical protein